MNKKADTIILEGAEYNYKNSIKVIETYLEIYEIVDDPKIKDQCLIDISRWLPRLCGAIVVFDAIGNKVRSKEFDNLMNKLDKILKNEQES